MNKYLVYFLVFVGVALIVYNSTILDFNNLFEGDSIIALIGIMAALCAIVLLLIFVTAKKIQKKVEG
ncbi:hypothetical protein [Sediminicola luteus]|uniref:Uncharacterized protein n=1 Tax=Sediminicola luteus TaxID=319238 RepID=A0A2A4GEF3_9FLAO|nr:hypothetical protein [Sediminicola luteus]PCE66356.1 hypothetical protein B7P33_03395 [Sediminicola luteus]